MHEPRRFLTLMMNTRKNEFLTWLRQSGIINEIFTLMFSCFLNVVDQARLDLDWRPFPVHVCSVHIQAIFLVERMLYYSKTYFWPRKLSFLLPYGQIGVQVQREVGHWYF